MDRLWLTTGSQEKTHVSCFWLGKRKKKTRFFASESCPHVCHQTMSSILFFFSLHNNLLKMTNTLIHWVFWGPTREPTCYFAFDITPFLWTWKETALPPFLSFFHFFFMCCSIVCLFEFWNITFMRITLKLKKHPSLTNITLLLLYEHNNSKHTSLSFLSLSLRPTPH